MYIDIGHDDTGQREYYSPFLSKFFSEKDLKSINGASIIVATYENCYQINELSVYSGFKCLLGTTMKEVRMILQ